ncbi:hypothetical protein C8F04DRAFT_1188379 [Mycena alexandri]|uniref:Ribonuclease H1 N-terminal domain-containing protein n=1 Tax=Mycena alexandri TaxID=1745969 RepID=A0AAD6SJM5_9AGAR|nr:hypothetical protein C8F04DRAFT_1188379 [Mycena alexandri]
MSKTRPAKSTRRKPSDTYRPGNPQLREKNRLAMQARRAAVKAKRRQWDPAKQREATPEVDDRSSASFDPQLVSHELLYGPLHFNDGRAASTSDGEDSAFKRMDARCRVRTETSEVNLPAQSIAAARLDEQLALEALVAMAQGSRSASQDSILQRANLLSSDDEDPQPPLLPPRAVTPPIFPYTPPREAGPSRKIRMANAAVAELNSKPLTPPTHIEARHWVRKVFSFGGVLLSNAIHCKNTQNMNYIDLLTETRVIPFAAVGEIAAVGPLLAPKPTFAAQTAAPETAKKGKRMRRGRQGRMLSNRMGSLGTSGPHPPPFALSHPAPLPHPPPFALPHPSPLVFPSGGVALLLCLALTLGLRSEAALSPSSRAAGEIRAPSTHKIMVAAKKGLLRVKSRLVFDELRRFLVTRAPRVGLTEFVASRANVEQMLYVLRKTNMMVEEMVPDLETPGHDRRFWCLPLICDDLDKVVAIGGGYEFHLVTRGRQVGVWRNWTVAQSMVTGYPDAAHKGHHTLRGCVREWQAHCQLGVHPHPVEPSRSSQSAGPSTPARRPRRSMSTPPSWRTSSHTFVMPSGMPEDAPAPRQYFALWRAGLVYSTRYHAGVAFDDAVDLGEEPSLLSTEDFEVALSYAEGRLD